MAVTVQQILDQHGDLLTTLGGPLDRVIEVTCSQEKPKPGAITFLAQPQRLAELLNSELAALVIDRKLADQASELLAATPNIGLAVLVTANTRLAMARINGQYFRLLHVAAPFDGQRIHPSAVIASDCQLGDEVIVGPGAVLHSQVKVGDRTYIGANTVIEARTTIGRDCVIHPQVYIGHCCDIGDRVNIKPQSTIGSDGFGFATDERGRHTRVPHYGEVIIGDDVSIGANVNIDRGTFSPSRIGRGTCIDNHCHFGHNIVIGEDCMITAGIISAGSVTIGDRCTFAGRVSVNGHISIASDCVIGPLSGVNNNVTEPGMYGGYPLVGYKEAIKIQASLISVPKLRRSVNRILRHLGLED